MTRLIASMTAVVAVVVLAGCGRAPNGGDDRPSAAAQSSSDTTAALPPPSTAAPSSAAHPKNFVELQVGDCVADLPPSDLSSVTVTVMDCGTAHLAQVIARRDIPVNEAIDEVADQQCAAALSGYPPTPGPHRLSVTYLIDSNQDRTSNNPLPSTVICLAQSADGSPLTGTLRH